MGGAHHARQEGRAPLVASNPASALALADDLARLMDDMTTRGVCGTARRAGAERSTATGSSPSNSEDRPRTWPEILAERGVIEPAARRDALIKAEAARLTAHTGGPVIAAGSTGSMPATAGADRHHPELPHGAVVLPGLDLELDAESWDLIGGRPEGGSREGCPAGSRTSAIRRRRCCAASASPARRS